MTEPQPTDSSDSVGSTRKAISRAWPIVLALVIVLFVSVFAGVKLWRLKWSSNRREGLRLLKTEGFARAGTALLLALEENDRDLEVLRELARGYYGLNKAGVAEKYLSQWCELEPAAVEAHWRRLQARKQLGWVDAALAEGDTLLTLVPENFDVQLEMIPLMIRMRHYADAEHFSRRLLETHPDHAGLRYYLAECRHAQGEDQAAHALLDAVLKDDPNYTEAWILRGILYGNAGDDAKALAALRQALELDPYQPVTRYYLSLALARTGETAEAEKEMTKVVEWCQGDRLIEDAWIQPWNFELNAKAAELLLNRDRGEGYMLAVEVLTKQPMYHPAMSLMTYYPKPKPKAVRPAVEVYWPIGIRPPTTYLKDIPEALRVNSK